MVPQSPATVVKETNSTADILGLSYWPFHLTPSLSPGADLVWVGRSEVRTQVDRAIRRLKRNPANSLNLMWADFGAGKTHTLLYLKNQVENNTDTPGFAVYAALPKEARRFTDVYRAAIKGITEESLIDAFRKAESRVGLEPLRQQVGQFNSSIFYGLQTLSIGSEDQRHTALSWLRAERGLRYSDLNALGISGHITSSDEAVAALSALHQVLLAAGYQRIFLLLDEFQRISELRGTMQNEINAGLHSVFNQANPNLSIVLSFSFGVEKNIKHFLNDELLSRADPNRVRLPEMTQPEAVEFINELVSAASNEDKDSKIDNSTVEAAVGRLASHGRLTARRLMKTMAIVGEEGGLDLEDNVIDQIDADYALNILTSDVMDQIVSDGEQEN
jgi:hypothetical protein